MTALGARILVVAAFVAACSGSPAAPSPTPEASSGGVATPVGSATPTAPGTISGRFTVNGGEVFLECRGTGSPTVLIETGLGEPSSKWTETVSDVAAVTRTCRFDRAGIGQSYSRPGPAELSVGDRADELHSLLEVAHVEGPFVLAGFSYGGMLIRAFAHQFGEDVVGLVFIDSSHEEQFVPGGWWLEQQPVWTDGEHTVDLARSRAELLDATNLGARPTIVLTSGQANGEIERRWSVLQDAIAAMATNSLHMVASGSGHDIRDGRPDLVVESIRAVVEAVRGTPLPTCGPRFEALGAECLASTMGDLLATWDARRAQVIPSAGALPAGTYSFTDGGATAVISIANGQIGASITNPDGSREDFAATYAAKADEVTIVWPFEFRIPRTPGINTARWTVDPDGTLHFVQLDSEPVESWLALPWVPVPPPT